MKKIAGILVRKKRPNPRSKGEISSRPSLITTKLKTPNDNN